MKKSYLVTALLNLLVGALGAHRYYTGHILIGVIQTLTLGGCGLWTLIDFILIHTGKFKDAQGNSLEDFNKNNGLIFIFVFLILPLAASAIFAASCTLTVGKSVKNMSGDMSKTLEETPHKKIDFKNASCTIYPNGHMCTGTLSEEDKIQIKRIKKELSNGSSAPVSTQTTSQSTNTAKRQVSTGTKPKMKKIKFKNTVCIFSVNKYKCDGPISQEELNKIKKYQAQLRQEQI